MQRTLPSLLAASAALASVAVANDSTLWVSDDVTNTIYEVSETGDLLRSWPSDAVSGLAVDPSDGTIWAALEGFDRIRHFDADGNILGTMLASDIYPQQPLLTRPEGVAVDYSDGSLWVVDDDFGVVYNFTTDGTTNAAGFLVPTVLSSFDTTGFATSLQGIAADPDGTLWMTDNVLEKVFHLTETGIILDEFDTSLFTGSTAFNENNSQGISVSEVDGTLWVTDRFQDTIYHLTRTGDTIATFPATAFDPNAGNITGVAFDLGEGGSGVSLGSATGFAALVYNVLSIYHNDTLIDGDVGLGAWGFQNFQGGAIDGDYLRDPEAYVPNYDDTQRLGGVDSVMELDDIFIDVLEAHDDMLDLPADQTYGVLYNQDYTIEGGTGVTVVDTCGILLWNDTLTLSGNPCSTFVINVHGLLRMYAGTEVVLEGGVRPENVFFNVDHCGWSVRARWDTVVNGSIIAPWRDILVGNESTVNGLIYTLDDALLWDGGVVSNE